MKKKIIVILMVFVILLGFLSQKPVVSYKTQLSPEYKTAIENQQNLIVEGCYIPMDWAKDFTEEYLPHISHYCLVMSEGYIRSHYDDIVKYANVVENRKEDDCSLQSLLDDNAVTLALAQQHGINYILIDQQYDVDITL